MRMTAALHPGMFFPRPTAVFASLAPPQAPAEGKLPAMRQKQPKTYTTITITNHSQCCEREDTTTLNNFGYTINGNQLFNKTFVLFNFSHD
jgi:hypothetical protein